jgi:hypothetical protein
MTTQSVENQTSSQDLMKKAKTALTPEQYARLEKKAIEKIWVLELAAMDLDKLKSKLPSIVAGEQDEADIMTRLEVEFPGIKTVVQEPKVPDQPKFTEHPLDWTTNKISRGIDAMTPDRFKEVSKMNKNGASSAAMATTALLWVSAGAAVETAGKTIKWWEKLRSNPGIFFRELWEVITSGSWTKIAWFFSGHMDSLGISTTTITKFADMMWLPTGLMGTATSLFATEKFWNMNYETLSKVWKQYQKTPDMNIAKELWVPAGDIKNAVWVLEKLFWKDSKGIVDTFVAKGGKETEIANLPMTDIIQRIVG